MTIFHLGELFVVLYKLAGCHGFLPVVNETCFICAFLLRQVKLPTVKKAIPILNNAVPAVET